LNGECQAKSEVEARYSNHHEIRFTCIAISQREADLRNFSGRPRPCKNAKVVYIEESDFFEAAT
jgi:hypothetical protein